MQEQPNRKQQKSQRPASSNAPEPTRGRQNRRDEDQDQEDKNKYKAGESVDRNKDSLSRSSSKKLTRERSGDRREIDALEEKLASVLGKTKEEVAAEINQRVEGNKKLKSNSKAPVNERSPPLYKVADEDRKILKGLGYMDSSNFPSEANGIEDYREELARAQSNSPTKVSMEEKRSTEDRKLTVNQARKTDPDAEDFKAQDREGYLEVAKVQKRNVPGAAFSGVKGPKPTTVTIEDDEDNNEEQLGDASPKDDYENMFEVEEMGNGDEGAMSWLGNKLGFGNKNEKTKEDDKLKSKASEGAKTEVAAKPVANPISNPIAGMIQGAQATTKEDSSSQKPGKVNAEGKSTIPDEKGGMKDLKSKSETGKEIVDKKKAESSEKLVEKEEKGSSKGKKNNKDVKEDKEEKEEKGVFSRIGEKIGGAFGYKGKKEEKKGETKPAEDKKSITSPLVGTVQGANINEKEDDKKKDSKNPQANNKDPIAGLVQGANLKEKGNSVNESKEKSKEIQGITNGDDVKNKNTKANEDKKMVINPLAGIVQGANININTKEDDKKKDLKDKQANNVNPLAGLVQGANLKEKGNSANESKGKDKDTQGTVNEDEVKNKKIEDKKSNKEPISPIDKKLNNEELQAELAGSSPENEAEEDLAYSPSNNPSEHEVLSAEEDESPKQPVKKILNKQVSKEGSIREAISTSPRQSKDNISSKNDRGSSELPGKALEKKILEEIGKNLNQYLRNPEKDNDTVSPEDVPKDQERRRYNDERPIKSNNNANKLIQDYVDMNYVEEDSLNANQEDEEPQESERQSSPSRITQNNEDQLDKDSVEEEEKRMSQEMQEKSGEASERQITPVDSRSSKQQDSIRESRISQKQISPVDDKQTKIEKPWKKARNDERQIRPAKKIDRELDEFIDDEYVIEDEQRRSQINPRAKIEERPIRPATDNNKKIQEYIDMNYGEDLEDEEENMRIQAQQNNESKKKEPLPPSLKNLEQKTRSDLEGYDPKSRNKDHDISPIQKKGPQMANEGLENQILREFGTNMNSLISKLNGPREQSKQVIPTAPLNTEKADQKDRQASHENFTKVIIGRNEDGLPAIRETAQEEDYSVERGRDSLKDSLVRTKSKGEKYFDGILEKKKNPVYNDSPSVDEVSDESYQDQNRKQTNLIRAPQRNIQEELDKNIGHNFDQKKKQDMERERSENARKQEIGNKHGKIETIRDVRDLYGKKKVEDHHLNYVSEGRFNAEQNELNLRNKFSNLKNNSIGQSNYPGVDDTDPAIAEDILEDIANDKYNDYNYKNTHGYPSSNVRIMKPVNHRDFVESTMDENGLSAYLGNPTNSHGYVAKINQSIRPNNINISKGSNRESSEPTPHFALTKETDLDDTVIWNSTPDLKNYPEDVSEVKKLRDKERDFFGESINSVSASNMGNTVTRFDNSTIKEKERKKDSLTAGEVWDDAVEDLNKNEYESAYSKILASGKFI